MKAIVVEEPKFVHVVEREKPVITRPDEVMIKVTCGGICGSDMGIFNATNAMASYPRLLGHEYGGEIVEVGSQVTNVKVGDKVAVDPVRSCGNCYACRIGRHNVCASLEVTGVHRDGGFAEFVVAPAKDVYKVDTSKISEEYICLIEPYSIGVQANTRGDCHKGDKVVVLGSGPIGMCITQVAKWRGAEVLTTDIVPERLERARKMGADRAVNVLKEDLKAAVMEFTDGEGATLVIDSVCSAASFPQALDLACPAGRVVTLGLNKNASEVGELAITKKELTVCGSRLSCSRFPEVIEGFECGALTPQLLRTHTFHFTEVEKAFDLISKHPEEICKVTLSFV